jgi:exodeoxyribonuclease VII large subunit
MTDLFSESTARTGIFPDEEVWTVSELAETMQGLLADRLPGFWIKGEIAEFKSYASGHWYFSLKDATCQVRCCMWKGQNLRVGRPPKDGTEIYALVKPDFYAQRGEFKLILQTLLPTSALGQHLLEHERVKQALAADGLFDPARKRPLPPMPTRIALVTSPDGAALRDFVTVARRRWPSIRLLLVASRVQGAEAEGELVRALGIVNRLDDVDLCIVGRGGGSKEDLAVFNSEAVCRALAQLRIPTVSAVGHETDVALTDFVADYRAPTPSAAMEAVVADRRELVRRVTALSARLAGALTLRTRVAHERGARLGERLQSAVERSVLRQRHRLDCAAGQLDALSPLRVLDRGYSMARDAQGRVLRRQADFAPGSPFTLRVSDGEVAARVATSRPESA